MAFRITALPIERSNASNKSNKFYNEQIDIKSPIQMLPAHLLRNSNADEQNLLK